MRMVKVEMLATAADENRVLERGKHYRIPTELAEQFYSDVGYSNEDGLDKPPRKIRVSPAARPSNVPDNKLTPITRTPDPEDHGPWGADDNESDDE